ncbi:MAG: hypothetical protein SVK08_00090 [Halobacteriota archaeon]|nr:hypothetical protein [Halobacteriota archaeon]
MKEQVLNAIKSLFPITSGDKKAVLKTVYLENESSYRSDDYPKQKSYIEASKTFGPPIYAEIEVYDGNKKLKSFKQKIGTLPVLTKRGTYIVNGVEYSMTNQFLLKPGIYTRQKQNQDIESVINIKGLSSRIQFDPSSEKFSIVVRQSKVPLYSLLKVMGASDSDMQNAWGGEILGANFVPDIGKDVMSLYSKFYSYKKKPDTIAEAADEIKSYFQNAEIDPSISEETIGGRFSTVSSNAILAASKKILDIYRGDAEPDNRDELRFKTIRTAPDFVASRVDKMANQIKAKVSASLARNPESLNASKIGDAIESTFTQSSLSEIPMEINPVTIMNAEGKTTVMGEDGISSVHGIPEESRNLHPSHIGFVDPIHTPESIKAGVTLTTAMNTEPKDGDLYTEVIKVDSGRRVKRSNVELGKEYVALPGEYRDGKFKDPKSVNAIYMGNQVTVGSDKIGYAIPDASETFSVATNMVPFIQHNQGNRVAMGSRQIPQAISLVEPEAPLVQVASPESHKDMGDTMEEVVARSSNTIVAPEGGVITKIDGDKVELRGNSGRKYSFDLYNNFPMFNKSFITNKPVVEKGQRIRKGDLIADTNFSKDGKLAIGRNLKVAYMPWHGATYEDGMVVSESAAQKLTSEHIIQLGTETKSTVLDKAKFTSMFPTKYTKEQLDKLDSRGIIKAGETVGPGDPVVLAMREEPSTPEDLVLGKLHKKLVKPYRDRSVEWDYNTPGKVTSSTISGGAAKVFVKTQMPAVVGDKVALRHGMKGVITEIVPDEEMPFSKDTQDHAEMIISPAGVISRMSIGQMLEAGASKIAKKEGKPFVVNNFSDKNYLEEIQKGLENAGMNRDGTEEFINKGTGKSYGKVLSGYPQVNKLFKTTKGNFSSRFQGHYDMNLRPTRGGEEGAKAIDFPQTYYSLVSHGAKANLRDAATYKGEYSPEAWSALMTGAPLPPPKIPFAYKKMEEMLRGAGINPKRDGSEIMLTPMTDQEVDDLASDREIKNFQMLRGDLSPNKGGLFDPYLTGGSNGQMWSKVTLNESIPNPLFEGAIKKLIGITHKDYRALIRGEKSVDIRTGDIQDGSDGLVGGLAIKKLLQDIDVDSEITRLRSEFDDASKTKKEEIRKKLSILNGIKKTGKNPADAFVINKVGVIPPQFRPIFELPNGTLGVSSSNYLYRDLGYVNSAVKDAKNLPENEKGKMRELLYESVGALQGAQGFEPVSTQAKQKSAKGLIKEISGTTPKTGFFQSKVMRKQQDLSGRATVGLDQSLGMDDLRIPEKMAKKLYGPFAIKSMVNMGYSLEDAKQNVEDLTEAGKRALNAAMDERPILMNRAPSLHKFSIMAFRPQMYDGLTVKVPGLVTKPFGMDFDGDTANFHVPFSEEARKEAFGMLPSKNIYQARTHGLNYMPDQEAVLGLYLITKNGRNLGKSFSNISNAIKAMKSGELEVTDVITIAGKRTTIGRELINQILPDKLDLEGPINKSEMAKILERVAKEYQDDYSKTVSELKAIGDEYSTTSGFTITLDDLKSDNNAVNKVYEDAKKKGTIEALMEADKKVTDMASKLGDSNNFSAMVNSGARGSVSNVKQIAFAPGVMTDMYGDIIKNPVMGSYGTGLQYPDYFTSLYGVRRGQIDVATMTAKPGAFNKEVLSATADLSIVEHDCGTDMGIEMDTKSRDIAGRTLARDYGQFKKDSIITSFMASKLPKTVVVRSPLTCESNRGICQMCYGYDERGNYPPIGENVGVKSTQSMTEPLTQAALKTKHTGGVASAGDTIGGFSTIQQFMQMPSNYPMRAILAKDNGTVESVEKLPSGITEIKISGETYEAPPRTTVLVSNGQRVSKGQKLNSGIPHPQDLMDISGPHSVTKEMQDIYEATGIEVDPKNIETVFRGITGYAEILDPGDDDNHVPGDIVPMSYVDKFNNNPENKNKIRYRRTAVGVNKASNFSSDWMARLGFRNLSRGLQEGALYGHTSDVSGYHPIPGFATGEMRVSFED